MGCDNPGSMGPEAIDKDYRLYKLKRISPPSSREFDKLIAEARKKGKQAGIKKSDIDEAVSKARGKRE